MVLLPLLKFHLASAGRVALRASLPQVVVLVVVISLQPSPGHFLGQLAQGVSTGDVWPTAPFALGLWSLLMAGLTARRLIPATRGWHRHLPVAPGQHRRAMWLATVFGQLPVIVFWLALWGGAWGQGWPVQGVYLASVPLLALAAGSLVLPSRRPWTLPLAAVAWFAAASTSGVAWGVGALALACRELLESGWKESTRKSRLRRPLLPLGWTYGHLWRVLGWRSLSPLPTAAVLMACCGLFLRNNDLDAVRVAVGVRLCGGMAMAAVILQLADRIRLKRPPWAWIRSQPWSARRRVLEDALFMALHVLPVVVAAAWLSAAEAPWAWLPLIPAALYTALRAAAALWRQPAGASRLGAPLYAETAVVILWLSVTAWTAWLLFALLPAAWGWAARAERGFKVSRFDELHDGIEGDLGL